MGSGDGQIDPPLRSAFDQGVRSALSAVCERFYDDFCSGFARRTPSLMAIPASIELKLPFKESIAMTTFI